MKAEEFRISDIRIFIKARQGKFEADTITMKIFGGDGKGSIKSVMTGESPEYLLDFAITKLRFEEMLRTFKQKISTHGELDLKTHLTMKGKNADEITRTVQGEISLRGHNLFNENLDIDLMLEKYERSQNFNLVDVGAFFVVGPLGPLLTKGYNFGSVYEESLGGKSTILKFVSDWKIKNGIAVAEDVALSTRQNRVALKGRLDFVTQQFDNVTLAVLDEKGCVRFSQKIYGPFRHPRVEKVSILRSIAGPVLNLYLKTKKFLENYKDGKPIGIPKPEGHAFDASKLTVIDMDSTETRVPLKTLSGWGYPRLESERAQTSLLGRCPLSYVLRRQRVAYDNIAVGTAMTRENLLSGTDIPTELPGASDIIQHGWRDERPGHVHRTVQRDDE